MRVTTKIIWDMETGHTLVHESYDYTGKVELCLGGGLKGFLGEASSEQSSAATSEYDFMSNLQNEQNQAFTQGDKALTSVQNAWAPIQAGGAYQYGFSSAEDAQLQGDITTAGANAVQQSENAALLREQQSTGGAGGPTGGQAAINAQIAATGAQATASNLAQEKEAGYARGAQLFSASQAGIGQVGSEFESAAGTAGSNASKAGEVANNEINTVNSENSNSLTNKLLGGAIQGGLSVASSGLGTAVSTLGSGNFGW